MIEMSSRLCTSYGNCYYAKGFHGPWYKYAVAMLQRLQIEGNVDSYRLIRPKLLDNMLYKFKQSCFMTFHVILVPGIMVATAHFTVIDWTIFLKVIHGLQTVCLQFWKLVQSLSRQIPWQYL